MNPTVIRALAVLCTLVASAVHAEESIDAWSPLPAHELAARRGGLRIGGLDVGVDVAVRDSIDGAAGDPGVNILQVSDLGGLNALIQLVNRLDGVRIERAAEIRVRVDGFASVFGSPALRTARSRLRNIFE